MVDIFSKSKRSRIMSQVKSRGNLATELRLINIFRKYGIHGWRRNVKIFGNPDFTFPQIRLTIFVDGCFWHGCPNHVTRPTSNQSFWMEKLGRNKTRDRLVSRILKKSGWRVVRIWQHELTQRSEKRLMVRLRKLFVLS